MYNADLSLFQNYPSPRKDCVEVAVASFPFFSSFAEHANYTEVTIFSHSQKAKKKKGDPNRRDIERSNRRSKGSDIPKEMKRKSLEKKKKKYLLVPGNLRDVVSRCVYLEEVVLVDKNAFPSSPRLTK